MKIESVKMNQKYASTNIRRDKQIANETFNMLTKKKKEISSA